MWLGLCPRHSWIHQIDNGTPSAFGSELRRALNGHMGHRLGCLRVTMTMSIIIDVSDAKMARLFTEK